MQGTSQNVLINIVVAQRKSSLFPLRLEASESKRSKPQIPTKLKEAIKQFLQVGIGMW